MNLPAEFRIMWRIYISQPNANVLAWNMEENVHAVKPNISKPGIPG